jgi:hypothetical protein
LAPEGFNFKKHGKRLGPDESALRMNGYILSHFQPLFLFALGDLRG